MIKVLGVYIQTIHDRIKGPGGLKRPGLRKASNRHDAHASALNKEGRENGAHGFTGVTS